jgi:hypothetical protein
MAGIDFDRQVFVNKADKTPPQLNRIFGTTLLVIAVAAIGLIGYKLFLEYTGGAASADSQGLDQIQQQLTDLGKRIDQLEKHRKFVVPEPTVASQTPTKPVPATVPPPRPAYKISSASLLQPQRDPVRSVAQPATPPAAVQSPHNGPDENAVANQEAWQATTDRLADVVGVVGSQQGELSRTREELNKLLAQTRRSAIQFELRHGANREPVGPVSLLLRNADAKNQRYTVCVYIEDQCIELKNRAVNEVVVFVLSSNSAPLELVATKVLRDQIVGYLEVPTK